MISNYFSFSEVSPLMQQLCYKCPS